MSNINKIVFRVYKYHTPHAHHHKRCRVSERVLWVTHFTIKLNRRPTLNLHTARCSTLNLHNSSSLEFAFFVLVYHNHKGIGRLSPPAETYMCMHMYMHMYRVHVVLPSLTVACQRA